MSCTLFRAQHPPPLMFRTEQEGAVLMCDNGSELHGTSLVQGWSIVMHIKKQKRCPSANQLNRSVYMNSQQTDVRYSRTSISTCTRSMPPTYCLVLNNPLPPASSPNSPARSRPIKTHHSRARHVEDSAAAADMATHRGALLVAAEAQQSGAAPDGLGNVHPLPVLLLHLGAVFVFSGFVLKCLV